MHGGTIVNINVCNLTFTNAKVELLGRSLPMGGVTLAVSLDSEQWYCIM